MVARYDELLSTFPSGSFYAAAGQILPFRDGPYQFLYQNVTPLTDFGIFVNDVFTGTVTSDIAGNAIITVTLQAGENFIVAENDTTGRLQPIFATVRNSATWLAAYAQVLEGMDGSIDQVQAAPLLEEVTSSFIEDVHGRLLNQPNDVGVYVNETYRFVLRQLRQAYRLWGAREAGLRQVVQAFTSSVPLVVPHQWRPHWVVGTQLAPNNDLQAHSRILDPATPLFNTNQRSRDYVRMSFASTLTSPLSQPSTPKKLTVDFAGGWPIGAHLLITGYLAGDLTETTELFTATPGGSTPGNVLFSKILVIQNLAPSGAATATIRTTDSTTTITSVTSSQPLPLHQPDAAQKMTVTFGAAWPGGNIVLTGTRPGGATVSETIPSSPGNTVTSIDTFFKVYTITNTFVGPGDVASVGLSESRFITIDEIGGLNTSPASLAFNLAGNTLSWSGGTPVSIPNSTQYHLHGTNVGATYHSLISTSGGFSPGNKQRLYLEIDSLGILPVAIAAIETGASIVAKINAAFTADVRYGATYGTTASLFTGTGFADTVIKLAPPITSLGPTSVVKIHAGGFDAAKVVFGEPRNATTLTAGAAGGATTLTVLNASLLPPTTNNQPFDIRVGRTERATGADGVMTTTGTPSIGGFSSAGLGAPVSTDQQGYVKISIGTAANLGVHRIISISPFLLLHENAGTGGAFAAAVGQTWALEPPGEVVTVISSNNTTTLTLAAPGLVSAKLSGALVELTTDMPFSESGHLGYGTLDVTVDRFFAPFGNTSDVGLILDGTGVPDGFQTINVSTASMIDEGYFVDERLMLTGAGTGDIELQAHVPHIRDYRGFLVQFTAWVQQSKAVSTNIGIDVSFDNGVTFLPGSFFPVPGTVSQASGEGVLKPFQIIHTEEVPFNATECIFRLHHFGSAVGDRIFVEQFFVSAVTSTGLFLGSNTIPRNDERTYFGEILYSWSPSILNVKEKTALGLPTTGGSTPTIPGHIDNISNAHGFWERFDVSEYSGSTPLNIQGVYTDLDWLGSTLSNLSIVVETPARLSRVVPVEVSLITSETLAPSGGGVANLMHVSNQFGTFPKSPDGSARLYINGIPAGDTPATVGGPDPWQWTGPNQITIDGTIFILGATYTFNYQRLTQAETSVIDLGTGFADYLWLMDAAIYRRAEVGIQSAATTVQLIFLGNLQATLQERSDEDKTTSSLIRDNGKEQVVIPSQQWSYVDSQTISVDATAFDPDSIYILTYETQTGSFPRQDEILIEERSATTSGGVGAALYRPVIENDVVNRAHRYHQIRITVNEITDVRDVSIAGLGLKGIHLYGLLPSAPGIL
jgi:hypothetical protein